MLKTTALQRLAAHVGGTIKRVPSTDTCDVHGLAIIAQELITPGKQSHTSTICPLAERDECSNTERVTHVM